MNRCSIRWILPHSLLLRHLSIAAAGETVETAALPAKTAAKKPQLPQKLLFRHLMGLTPDGRVADVLHYYIREGYAFGDGDLNNCIRGLRKFKRYEHCYQILEWMDKGRYTFSARDKALRLDITFKFKGAIEAEEYFDSLSPKMKNRFTYGALLHSYCKELMVDKAVALFKEMDKLNLVSPLALNNLMTMSLKLGQPEKLPSLVQEMKDRNFPATDFSRALLMQACSMMNDIEGVERVFNEVSKKKCDWTIYSNLATAYFKAGLFEKADSALKQLEELLEKEKCVRSAYFFLITFHASAGNSAGVFRVWDSLKSHYPSCHNVSYLCLLHALSRLDNIDDLTKYFGEWNTNCRTYDPRLAIVVLRAYLNNDMINEAELVFEIAGCKVGAPCFRVHEMFMDYYLEKEDMKSGLRHMEACISKGKKGQKWKPKPAVIDSFFNYFEKQIDVDGMERLCILLKAVDCLDSIALSKIGAPCFRVHEMFIDHYLEKEDMESGLRHMEACISKGKKDQKWKPKPEVIDSFFNYFERQRDVDGMERLCTLLKEVDCLDSRAYSPLVWVYVASGKTDLEIKKSMEKYGLEKYLPHIY
ncbi:hypothetical protein Dimus_033170 [Dionaea muscipula]